MVGSARQSNSSVYVGDLAETVTEQLLHQVFGQAGTIVSVRLCRDSVTRRPLGYAYVNYASPADAARALETLNHVELCGRQVRLMPSQRDPALRRSGVGNVFAKNLDPEKVTNRVLHQTFEAYGRVLSAKVATDARGHSRGYGFVQFEDPECAQKAIDGLNHTDLCGQQLFVGHFIPAKDRALEPGKFCNVYVRNLGSEVTEDTLADAFSGFGPISSTVVMRNAAGKSRGFGFVNFEHAEDAANAVASMDGHRHQGMKWRVDRAQKRSDAAEASQPQARPVRGRLYLRNVGPSITEVDLHDIFEEFGTVESTSVLKDAAGNSKGVAYVHFEKPEDAEAAITGMNGRTVGDSQKPLFVTLAQRSRSTRPEQPPVQPPPLQPPPQPPRGMVHPTVSIGVTPIPVPGIMAPNMAYFPPSAPFYFGPMAMQPSAAVVPSPYYMSVGGHPMYSEHIRDRSMASFQSAMFPGSGVGGSAALRMGGGLRGPGEGGLPSSVAVSHRRQRRPASQQPSRIGSMEAQRPGALVSQIVTSPFSSVQMQPGPNIGKEAPESSSSAQRRELSDRVAELAGKAAPDVTQSILQRLSSVQIGELLLDEDALAEEVDAHFSVPKSQESSPRNR